MIKPGHAALGITAAAIGEIGIAIGAESGPRSRGEVGIPIAALPIRGFGLLHPNKHILRVVEVVLVQRIVFDGRSVKPSSCGGLH